MGGTDERAGGTYGVGITAAAAAAAADDGGEVLPSSRRPRCCAGLGARARAALDFVQSPAFWRRADDQKKTLPDQWRIIHSNWRFAHALLCYCGPPIHTIRHIGIPVLSVMALCVAIKLAEGRVSWQLDRYNNYAVLFRYSS